MAMVLSIIKSFFTMIFSTVLVFYSSVTGLWTNQLESIRSVEKVTEDFYTMDYTYDYDIDELLERGLNSTVGLMLYGAYNTMGESVKNRIAALTPNFGCTTFNSVNSEGEYLFSRNYDYMESPGMLVWTHPKDGYASVSNVSLYFLLYSRDRGFLPEDEFASLFTLLAPYIPVDGMNEKGLSVGVLELENDPTFQISDKKALTTTTMVRAVLDKAATVDEAIAIFNKYDMRDLYFDACTYHYQIADANGNSVVIEYVDGKINLIYPEKKIGNLTDYISAANYYLTPGVYDPNGLGYDRVETVYSALNASKGLTSENQAMNILESASVKDMDMNGYICSTLWSAVYNTHDLSIDICVNNNYSEVYRFSLDTPQLFTMVK